MRIVITGASGFLGRHVTMGLIERGYNPIIMLRPDSPIPTGMQGLECVRHDLHEEPEKVVRQLSSPDLLIHLAWGGLPNYRSMHHLESELPLQYRFLRSVIEAGLGKLLVTGTCFEYGMQYGPLAEDRSAAPENSYGSAKSALLTMLCMLAREKPFELTWARLFYLFGEGQSKSSLFSQLRQAATAGEKDFPMSGGEQLRDFMPISQFLDEFIRLSLTPGGQGVVNVCTGTPISVRQLVEKWIDENDWNIKLDLGVYPYPDYEPMAFWGVRKKLDSILKT